MESVETTLLQEFPKQKIVPDSILVQIGKRLYSVAPILAMTFSTIKQIFTVGTSVASQSTVRSYTRDIEVISGNQYSYYTCEYGNADAVVTYCPYESLPAFQGILALWCIYFVLFIFLRLLATAWYSTHDLRFYIAIDRYNGHPVNKWFVVFGYFLTLISVVIGLYYMSPTTEWNNVVDTNSLLSIIVFIGINVVALNGLLHMTTSRQHPRHLEDFPNPVFIHGLGGSLPMLASASSIITPLLVSYTLSITNQDETLLSRYGDSGQLKEVAMKLFHVEN